MIDSIKGNPSRSTTVTISQADYQLLQKLQVLKTIVGQLRQNKGINSNEVVQNGQNSNGLMEIKITDSNAENIPVAKSTADNQDDSTQISSMMHFLNISDNSTENDNTKINTSQSNQEAASNTAAVNMVVFPGSVLAGADDSNGYAPLMESGSHPLVTSSNSSLTSIKTHYAKIPNPSSSVNNGVQSSAYMPNTGIPLTTRNTSSDENEITSRSNSADSTATTDQNTGKSTSNSSANTLNVTSSYDNEVLDLKSTVLINVESPGPSDTVNPKLLSNSSGYSYEQFCNDLNVNDDYILRLLDLLVQETASGTKTPQRLLGTLPGSSSDLQGSNSISNQHSDQIYNSNGDLDLTTETNDLDDYFLPSPVLPEYVDYDRDARLNNFHDQPSHRRMLVRALNNGYYSNNSPASLSPPVLEPESLSSSLSNSPIALSYNPPTTSFPPLDITSTQGRRAQTQRELDEDEHWRRQYSRRLRREQERSESTTLSINNSSVSRSSGVIPHPSSLSSMSSFNPESVGSSPNSLRPSGIDRYTTSNGHTWNHPTTNDRELPLAQRESIWDTYDDPSLEGLVIQSINGVSLSNSWDD